MTDPKPVLIGYARVSTEDQNLELQRDALLGHGVEEVRIYSDKASGASLQKRPGLAAAMKACRPGDVLVVWKLDRLGRNLEELILTVRRIQEKGAHFRCLTQPFDTSSPMGLLIFHIFGAMAQFERELGRERAMAGLAAARVRGRIGGRKTVLDPAKQEHARQMLAAGMPISAVAKRLKLGKSTLYKWRDAIRPDPVIDDPTEDSANGK
jgi:DNA invertase Pin-like site-specific DNA recombinase